MKLKNLWNLCRILLNRRITRTPITVFRELKEKNQSAQIRNRIARSFFSRFSLLRVLMKWIDGEALTRHEGQWIINTFIPPFPGPAYDRLFTALLSDRKWNPVSAYLAITLKCPARCGHCSIKRRKEEELAASDWIRIIEELRDLGTGIIGITGGEPLVRPDLEDLIRSAHQGGASVMLFTSGIGLTEKRAHDLKKAGLWALCVSLDRTDENEIDALRGYPGAGRSAMNALRFAKKAGLYTCVNCVADQDLVRGKIYRTLYEKAVELKADEFRLIEPMPCGNLLNSDPEIFLNKDQIAEIRKFHRDTNRKIMGFFSPKRTKVCSFNEIESPELFGCAGGTRHLFIDPGGNVCPCDFTPLSFGNAMKEPLEIIWKRMSGALKHPRRHCMVQNQRELIQLAARSEVPAPVHTSLQTVEQFPEEDLPDFLKWTES
ncbi:MAG: radical SAM protein [Planctomycetia bacterium]|nr:radical SAM protein [Planctomycetia bacterium]